MLIVQVEVPGRALPLSCATRFEELEVGDRLLVEWSGKTTFGWVVRVPLDLEWSRGRPPGKVLRRASRGDEERQSHLEVRREEWLETAREQVREHGLEMRILRADLAPSAKKVTFFFTADGRVDFRALVRDLARLLRARVELRQIGVRDSTVLQGGMGHCGQQLCCARFLDGFSPVSMRMAKAQGLPLNPSKISGQCGRLMCCLRYELSEEQTRDRPRKRGSRGRSGNGGGGKGCSGQCGRRGEERRSSRGGGGTESRESPSTPPPAGAADERHPGAGAKRSGGAPDAPPSSEPAEKG